VKNDGMDMP